MEHRPRRPASGPAALRPGIAGMLWRMRLFPLHSLTARTGIARRLHAARTRKSEAILAARGHTPLLADRHADAMPQDAADLVYLYDLVSRHRPARAIELGSGQSTIVIAQALHDIGAGHLWSLDANAGWLANSERSLPAHLRPFVTFVHSPAQIHFDHGVAAFRYSVVRPGEWDFVLIDGPALTTDVGLSSDLAELPLAPRAVGMIDHRWRSAVLAAEQAGGRLHLRYMPSLESFAIRARRRRLSLVDVRSALSAVKARIEALTSPRHRAFHAQRKVTDPVQRERLADQLAISRPLADRPEPDGLAALRQFGILDLGNLLSDRQIADIRTHFADKLACDLRRRHLGRFVAPGSVPRQTHGAEYGHADVLAAPHLLRLANHPRTLELVEGYLGTTPVISALRAWWTVPTPGADPEATELFHRDFDDYRFLKLFVYLTDVDEQSGPHVFARGSHTSPALGEIRRYRDDEVIGVVEQDDLLRVLGRPGTAFLAATYGLHRATPPITRPRLAFSALYTMRPTNYGPARPIRYRSDQERDLSPYVNQVYLRA